MADLGSFLSVGFFELFQREKRQKNPEDENKTEPDLTKSLQTTKKSLEKLRLQVKKLTKNLENTSSKP